jgi:hypothetical protein
MKPQVKTYRLNTIRKIVGDEYDVLDVLETLKDRNIITGYKITNGSVTLYIHEHIELFMDLKKLEGYEEQEEKDEENE